MLGRRRGVTGNDRDRGNVKTSDMRSRDLRWHAPLPGAGVGPGFVDRVVKRARGTYNGGDLDLRVPIALHDPFDLLARVHHNTLDLALTVAREIRVGYIFEMALYSLLVVNDVHVAALVDPQLAHNYVVHGRRDLAPRVMVVVGLELQVCSAQWNHLSKQLRLPSLIRQI
jgi:hypothetical protein